MINRLVWVVVISLGSGCAGDGTGLDENGVPLSLVLNLTPGDVALVPSGTVQIGATDGAGGIVAAADADWSSSNTAIARVEATGLVTAVSAGSATISATRGLATGTTDISVVPTAAFAADVQAIFTANCAFSGCHAGPNPQQGQDLSAGNAYANIVNVSSRELPSMLRVNPGNPLTSYLVHKIRSTQESVGGSGVRMPFGGVLPQTDIDVIRAWVQSGAPNN